MYCSKCGNDIKDGDEVCSNCGKPVDDQEEKKVENKYRRIKIRVGEVINKNAVLNSTNKVAYIANGWALQVKNRGEFFGILTFIIFFFIGVATQSSIGGNTQFWIIYTIAGIIAMLIIIAIFNTIAFVIRMGAEVIQLLDDIKNK